ncbi:MAG: stage III sporulation protein AC [Clostridia bacterium]|nr:stage III sporulation protein AC [Clostridia bacterium]
MNIEFVFKIGAIGILITVISQILGRVGREDIATLSTLAGLIIVLMMVLDMVSEFFESIRVMFNLAG